MSTPKEKIIKINNCFGGIKLVNPKDKQETIQESIKDDKQFMVNFFAQQPYYSELMPKIKKASRGIVFYKGLIQKGVKNKSVFFEAIMRSIKKVNMEKIAKRPRSKKRIKLYKLPKIQELKIKKKKIESVENKKKKLLQLENDKFNVYREEIKKKLLPFTTKHRKKSPIVYSTNTIFYNNNRYMQSNNSTNNSFMKNSTNEFEQNLILSPMNNDISTYYRSNDTFKTIPKNGLFTNRFPSLRQSNSSNDINFLLDRCQEEIINGKEVENLVLDYNKNFMKSIQEKIYSNRFMNRDRKMIEEKKKDNKYIQLEEKNYANIKKRMNERISDTFAYKNRKELREILKVNENARSYILHLVEMNKVNEKLGRRRVIEWKRIDKVNSMCDVGFRKNEYLKNKIDKINDKNHKLNKSRDYIPNDDFYTYKNNKDYMIGKLVPKLMAIKKKNDNKDIYEYNLS